MRNVTIVESNVEPNKEHLWFYNGKLKWFGPNGWEEINPQVLSPTTTTTTPKPVVSTTTTTSTPSPTTTTTTTTSTSTPTFKLTNNTGDTLKVIGFGIVNGMFSTKVPPVPNEGSVLLSKIPANKGQAIYIHSDLHPKLSIIVDGEDKGESLIDIGNDTYRILPSIYMAATEISVHSL